MSQDPGFDASIPVLTEVVPVPAPAAPEARDQVRVETPMAPPFATAPPAPATAPSGEALERRAIERWSGEEWSVLERRVTERILQQLQGRVDFVLEQRLRAGIADAVDKAMAGFAAEIQGSLHETLGQVVARAVSQEISHLQTLGK